MEPLLRSKHAVITRNAPPNKMDTLPKGTVCKVIRKNESPQLFIQRSPNEEKPYWEKL